ncbi:MAG: hypothetical protein ACK504_02395 [Bacteroidota bacterium]|jgi:hypothetical protein
MKKSKINYLFSACFIISLLIFASCKKNNAFKNEDGQASEDNTKVQSENDAAINDVNTEIGYNSLLRGKGVSTTGVNALHAVLGIKAAGYSVDTNGAYRGTIKINYDGTTINNRKRTGIIRLTILNYSSG